MRVRVVLNLRSSRSRKILRELPGRLAAHGLDVAELSAVGDRGVLEKHVRRLAKQGSDPILIGGGDGAMTCAANALAYRDVALGILPLGTGNSFALSLGLDGDLDRAIAVIAGGRTVPVDLGIVNGRYFANFATIGLSSRIAAATSHQLKALIGAAAYAVAGIVPFLQATPFRARVRWPGGKLKLCTQDIIIASGRAFGKTPLLPNASLTDGALSFFTTSGVTHFDVARTYIALRLGKHTSLPDAHLFSAPRIDLKAKPKQHVFVDGNDAGMTPAHFAVAERALRVFVPPSFVDEGR